MTGNPEEKFSLVIGGSPYYSRPLSSPIVRGTRLRSFVFVCAVVVQSRNDHIRRYTGASDGDSENCRKDLVVTQKVAGRPLRLAAIFKNERGIAEFDKM